MQFTSSLRRAGPERSIFSAHSSIWANAYILVRSMREKNNARYLQLTTDIKFVFRGNLPDRNLGYAIVKRNRSVTEPLFGSFHSRQLFSLAGFLV
jgi:hypothetical protein